MASVSMRDVARLAGVSQRTVSNVVNDATYVRPETRARVQQAIGTLRYRPNVSAQKLRSGRTGLVALALPEIEVPYFADLAANVQRRASELGVTLLIDQTGGTRERELLVLDGYHSNMIDGLILNPLSITALDLSHRDLGFPVVLLGESIDTSDVVHISIDNVGAARAATVHLLELGRTQVAALGAAREPATSGPGPRRLRGYSAALGDAGYAVESTRVLETSKWNRANGYAAAADIVEQRLPVDALFCFNDLLALGALKAFSERGVRVPDDIAIVGWDDTEECAYATPGLTSISPDKESIASMAIERLMHLIAGDPSTDTELVAAYRLVVRGSSDPSMTAKTSVDGVDRLADSAP